MKKTVLILALILVLGASVLKVGRVQADVAPPEAPPGTTLLPGESTTQVRMAAETVILTISADPSDARRAIAKTEASFTMRNMGAVEEKMTVRFPLSFFNGNSDGNGGFPEISSIAVKVDGKAVPTRREIQPFSGSEYSYPERDQIPWAVFDATFPPNQDVTLEVAYTVNGFGYYPYQAFKYILETGAGWNGTIGSARVIVRLPYKVGEQNLDLSGEAGHGESSYNGVIKGNEISWAFTDLEPSYLDNIQVVVVTPSLWQKTLTEKDIVSKNPNDGEAWGRLAKAYKEVVKMPKGYLRADRGGEELFALSKDAYETCLALLPNDPLWHYGYADLLWSYYYYQVYLASRADTDGILPQTLSHLQTALELDPNTKQARDLLTEISYSIPEAVQMNGNDFVYLGLTAAPLPPTPWLAATETAFPSPTRPSPTNAPAQPEPSAPPTETPPSANPLCGSSALIVPALAGALWMARRKKS